MKLGIVTAEFINNDVDYNLNKIVYFLEKSYSKGLDMIFFGEAFLQGFDALKWNLEDDLNIAITCNDEIINTIRKKVRELSIGLGFGYIEKDGDFIYCSYLILDKDGKEICNYRRVSKGWKIKGVQDNYSEGDSISTFNFENKLFKVALCGDLFDDNYLKEYCDIDSDISLWPLYVNFDLKKHTLEYLNRVEGNENVLIINSLSKEPKSVGGSFYIKDNTVGKSMKNNEEGLLIINI